MCAVKKWYHILFLGHLPRGTLFFIVSWTPTNRNMVEPNNQPCVLGGANFIFWGTLSIKGYKNFEVTGEKFTSPLTR